MYLFVYLFVKISFINIGIPGQKYASLIHRITICNYNAREGCSMGMHRFTQMREDCLVF